MSTDENQHPYVKERDSVIAGLQEKLWKDKRVRRKFYSGFLIDLLECGRDEQEALSLAVEALREPEGPDAYNFLASMALIAKGFYVPWNEE